MQAAVVAVVAAVVEARDMVGQSVCCQMIVLAGS
jgi:hypothetical protein